MAFRHGYLGIRYDDQDDLEKIQDRLDRIFCSLPPKTICCRLRLDGVVIYPHPMFFQIGSNNYPWSFERNGARYADFSFKSQEWFERRQRLLSSLRKIKRKIPSLYHMTLLSCSTREYKWFRFHVVSYRRCNKCTRTPLKWSACTFIAISVRQYSPIS